MKLLSFLLLTLVATFPALADTPVGPMNYQGRLLDNAGIPVTGFYDFVVKIYNDPAAGILQYQESHDDVPVDDGVYSFKIGTGTAVTGTWDINLWQSNLNDLFLEVVVNGETLTPRHELTSAPHAFTATLALSAGALGNKTAAEYDNILEGVCAASKGKWLDILQRCLGVASSITDQDVATMASDLDYSGLDLSKADITNTVFTNANFSNTVFKGTTLTISGFSGANLSGALLDGVTSTNSMPNMSINLTNATITNMSLAGWSMSGATVTGLSAANLSACPSSLPASWQCAEMKSGSGTYFLFGPGANLSAESAAAIAEPGILLLNVDDDHFAGENLSGANFKGINLSSINFSNTNLSNANLDFTTLLSGTLNNANLANASFRYSEISSTLLSTATLGGNDFSNSNIDNTTLPGGSNMLFKKATLRTVSIGPMTNANFSYAQLDTATFSGDMFGTLNFTNTKFWNNTTANYNVPFFSATLLTDNITAIGRTYWPTFAFSVPAGTVLNNITLDAVNLGGRFDSITLNNCVFRQNNITASGSAKNTTFNNCQITDTNLFFCGAAADGVLRNTVFNGGAIAGPTGQYATIDSAVFAPIQGCNMGAPDTPNVTFTNVAFSNVQFSNTNWNNMPNTSCTGCTFTNTRWDQSATCPNGSSPVETPAASGIYQCAGWY